MRQLKAEKDEADAIIAQMRVSMEQEKCEELERLEREQEQMDNLMTSW